MESSGEGECKACKIYFWHTALIFKLSEMAATWTVTTIIPPFSVTHRLSILSSSIMSCNQAQLVQCREWFVHKALFESFWLHFDIRHLPLRLGCLGCVDIRIHLILPPIFHVVPLPKRSSHVIKTWTRTQMYRRAIKDKPTSCGDQHSCLATFIRNHRYCQKKYRTCARAQGL